MNPLLLGCLACLAAFPLFPARAAAAATVPLDVELKIIDDDNHPLAGVSVRLVFGVLDWQAPAAGVKVVSGDDGTATLTAPAVIERRWSSVNIGFTPFSQPVRVDRLMLAMELPLVIPKRDGGETEFHFLYTARIDRLLDGDCSTDDLDQVYEAAPDGRFTKLVGSNASGPNFSGTIDGWKLGSAGYKLSDFMLKPKDGTSSTDAKSWALQLGLKRFPKPVIMK